MDEATWRERIEAARRHKDHLFQSSEQSPIPEARRGRFRGLRYYPPDARYHVAAKLKKKAPKRVLLRRSGGDEAPYERVGFFKVKLPEGKAKLAAYRDLSGHEESLFIPFQDKTSGHETYGAGRYLEAHADKKDRYLLDFNTAYHPYCAYNADYTCPMPPKENRVKAPVYAGERLPRKKGE